MIDLDNFFFVYESQFIDSRVPFVNKLTYLQKKEVRTKIQFQANSLNQHLFRCVVKFVLLA